MSTEKKQTKRKKKQSQEVSTVSEELVFVDKEKDCTNCPDSVEQEITLPLAQDKEWDIIIPLLDKFRITPQEMQYIYNFYNRVFKDNRSPGCGKCFIRIAKNLKNRYRELYG
jgi:hypothetical protein